MTHPAIQQLALYAGGDVPLSGRLNLLWHLQRCKRCSAEVEALKEARLEIKDAAGSLPPAVNWERMSAEMRANIRLGLAAGAIVDQPSDLPDPVEPRAWRVAIVCASLAFVMATGWWLDRGSRLGVRSNHSHAVAAEGGVAGLREGATFSLLNPSEQPVTTTVSWDGDVRSRYVDSETGQVTIQHVYQQ